MSEIGTRYVIEVQRGTGCPWGPPSVGGISDGFSSQADAEDLIAVLKKHDRDYYRWCAWRVVKVTREVVPVPASVGGPA